MVTPSPGHIISSSEETISSTSHTKDLSNLPTILEDDIGSSKCDNKENEEKTDLVTSNGESEFCLLTKKTDDCFF